MEELKKSYTEDVEKINHQLAENKLRQADHLQAKLAARRQRRARKTVEEKEAGAIVAEVGGGKKKKQKKS